MRLGLLVLVACSSAEADEVCNPTGAVLFEIHQGAAPKAKLTTATTKLFENGAWTIEVFDRAGKRMRTDAGCLKSSALDAIRNELRDATWKTAPSALACRADQPRFTTYTWSGRLLFTERTCNADVLDKRSMHALDVVTHHVRLVALDAPPDRCIGNPLASGCM